MNNRTAFAKASKEWTQIEHNVCGRRAAWTPLWWWPCIWYARAAWKRHVETKYRTKQNRLNVSRKDAYSTSLVLSSPISCVSNHPISCLKIDLKSSDLILSHWLYAAVCQHIISRYANKMTAHPISTTNWFTTAVQYLVNPGKRDYKYLTKVQPIHLQWNIKVITHSLEMLNPSEITVQLQCGALITKLEGHAVREWRMTVIA